MKEDCIKGKTAVVTGARRGIGRALALAFAAAGADVAVCDLIAEDGLLEKTRDELNALGSRSLHLQTDISRHREVEAAANRVAGFYGKIDVLANCAGVWIPGETLIECSEDNWDKVMDTNLKGTYLCCQAFGKLMIQRGSGSIINMSSQVGLTPGAGAGAYSVSKAGIIMLTRLLALELAPYRVRVNAIAPGIVKTDFNAAFWKAPEAERAASGMVPLGRLAEPEDVARCALFLASNDADYITGETIAVNGGWHPTAPVKL